MNTVRTSLQSSATAVELPRPLVNQLLSLAQHSPDREICGLIGVTSEGRFACYPVRNVSAMPESRFALDPGEQINVMRQMREAGESLFAIFHSHPSAPAQPSTADEMESRYPDVLYLIISLNTKGVLDMRGFRRDAESQFTEIQLVLGD